jgi:hypothetical protein
MILKHKRTGDLYRFLGTGFSVELQEPVAITCRLNDGAVFTRRQASVEEHFETHEPDGNAGIEPKIPSYVPHWA